MWIATFGDVTKYMREREAANIQNNVAGGKIIVTLNHSLDKSMYYLPLTLKTYVSANWKKATIRQGKHVEYVAKCMQVAYAKRIVYR